MRQHQEITSSMADRIRLARKAKKLTQGKLAQLVGISVVTLNRFENGHRTPPSDILGLLAEALNCDTQWIVSGEKALEIPHQVASDDNVPMTACVGWPDPVIVRISQILENDLPEAKEHILNILVARMQMKRALNALGLTAT